MTSVLVVDDSQFMRTVLATMLGEHGYDVHTASDGESAIDAAVEKRPDVITMDVQMPGMGGIEAVEEIVSREPTPILMLSAYTRDGADATLDALSRGAIDFLPKPSGEISANIEALEDDLVETIEAVTDADVGTMAWNRAAAAARTAADAERAVLEASASVAERAGGPAATAPASGSGDAVGPTSKPGSSELLPRGQPGRSSTGVSVPSSIDEPPTVVVGASTGGPRIVERLLAALPSELDARVLVVQHMPASFTDRLARRVDHVSDYDVREASDGTRVRSGEAVVARGGYHMEVCYDGPEHCRVELTEDERQHGVRPAIDVTMQTAAAEVDGPLVGVALTGMGSDGAAGISAIKAAGGATIAQDEASAPVYGIPRHAVATGDVDRVCSDRSVVAEIVDAVAELSTDGSVASDQRPPGGETT